MLSSLRIVVTGLIAQHHRLGGVAWDYIQYPVGLSRLGHDVYYFEDSGEWPYSTVDAVTPKDCSANVQHLNHVMTRFGLADRWAYRCPITATWHGLTNKRRREIIGSADVLINVSGVLQRPLNYRKIPRLVYVDSDPVFTQIKLALDRGHKRFQKRLNSHDVFFSFGENIHAWSQLPDSDRQWLPTRQPILLSEWNSESSVRDEYTTVMSWTSYKPLRYQGLVFGQKDTEMLRFIDLPRRVRPGLELALAGTGHTKWQRVKLDGGSSAHDDEVTRFKGRYPGVTTSSKDFLQRAGWTVIDGLATCKDMDSYRRYIESSKAEWSVAKNGYVRGESGWFSCRSACYLAAGKPVVVQDTGFGRAIPVGDGILSFDDMGEAVAAIEDIEANYTRHSRAAREIAREYFFAEHVLAGLVEDALACGRSQKRNLSKLGNG
ncbi:glycosyltransferase [Pseudomonadota bacterium]